MSIYIQGEECTAIKRNVRIGWAGEATEDAVYPVEKTEGYMMDLRPGTENLGHVEVLGIAYRNLYSYYGLNFAHN